MIQSDWTLSRLALQIIAEEGPGKAAAMERTREDAALASSLAALRG